MWKVLVFIFLPKVLSASNSNIKDQNELTLLMISKSKLEARLQTLPENLEDSILIRSFKIAKGKEEGDKVKKGDNRTPEGIYFTLAHIPKEQLLASKYGEKAIPLNFPNPVDAHDGKTGYGIWLHGAGDDARMASANVTEGCVAFYNADILKLQNWLKPQQSVVVIANDLSTVNQPKDIQDLKFAFHDWMDSWKQTNLERYISHYHNDFSLSGKNKKTYRDYKKHIFASYKKMDIKITNQRFITHPKYAVVLMNQDFQGDKRFTSKGTKIIYWMKSDNQWLIVREIFGKGRFTPLQIDSSLIASLNDSSDSKNSKM